ncbi:acyl carrier protein [Rhodohalobacter sulfatireducens]|uniref:Acyl carrier protein n=1 Tax=Rhodohalobacter sulfatireducens TaxID=2911366 RepID=A0ABS9KIX1_9BACT|nr:acyl carrier protein [Rhodohalobacter sulfatireducens]MCG2590807.1 acyl carrier protein [Rhodohalobacter sulfatireducens]
MIQKIKAYIQSELTGDSNLTLSEDDDLLGSGIIDSMGIMKLVAFIEKEADIKVSPGEMVIENFKNLNAIEEYLKSKQD